MLWGEDQSPRVKKKGKKAYVERKVGECFQWKAHGQFSKGDSCSFSHDTKASGNSGGDQRPKGRSSPASHSKAKQTDGEKATKRKILTREVRFCVDLKFVKKKKKKRRVIFGIFPCVKIASLATKLQVIGRRMQKWRRMPFPTC